MLDRRTYEKIYYKIILHFPIICCPCLSKLTIYFFSTVLADPFGISNYDNPAIVTIQGLRVHPFEVHDATNKANSSEMVCT